MSKVWGKMWLGKRLRRSEGKDLSPPPPCILNLGERGCEVGNGLCHGLTDGNGWTARKWESLRSGGLVPVADAGFRRACLCVRSRSMRGRYAV